MTAPRVLVVDDDPDLLELVAMLLESERYDVRAARDGADALRSLEEDGPVDLVLLDLKMPVMDGAEFARRFRERYGEAAPIVVFTAADDARRRALDVNAAAWLSKPFNLDRLLATIRTQLAPRAV